MCAEILAPKAHPRSGPDMADHGPPVAGFEWDGRAGAQELELKRRRRTGEKGRIRGLYVKGPRACVILGDWAGRYWHTEHTA